MQGGLQASTEQTSGTDDRLAPGSAIALAVLIVSTFTVVLNEMVMAVALPSVMADLHVTTSTAQWLTSGYILTTAVIVPITGYLSERLTMRTVFTLAMSVFVVGTVIAAGAPGLPVLMFGRVVQAVGTAIIIPLTFTAVNTLTPPSRIGRMMALVTIAASMAPSVGPVVAGAILTVGNWRWLFLVILPVAALCLAQGHRSIRVPGAPKMVRLDLLSVLLSKVGFAAIVYGLAPAEDGAQASGSPWLVSALGAAAVALFVWRQLRLQRTDRAVLDMRPFAARTFAASALVGALFLVPAFGIAAILPFVLQTSYGLDTLQAGLFMSPSGLITAAASLVVGRLYDRFGPRPLMLAGTAVNATGLWFLSTLAPGVPIWVMLLTYMLVIGGQAFVWTPIFAAALGAVDQKLLPHGSAIINTVQQLAGAAGIATMFSIMSVAAGRFIAGGTTSGLAMAQGAQQALRTSSILVLAALVVVFLFIPRRQPGR